MISLQSGSRYTAKALAEKFEVSIKSVYRAIDVLLSAGMPITSIQGKNGGYELIKESKINSSFFTMDELSSFISFIKSNPNSYSKHSLDERLLSLNNKSVIENIKTKSQEVVIDTNLWGLSCKDNEITDIIKKQIHSKKKIIIEYFISCSNRIDQRIIHPYTLVYKMDNWYLYAFCEKRNSFRLFKLTKIKNYNILDENFEIKNIDVLSKPWNLEFKNNLEEIEIELICPTLFINDIKTWLNDVTTTLECDENGKNKIKGKALYSIGLIHKIMEYGDKIKILKPDKLKNALCYECLSIYNYYNNKSANL